MVAPESISIRRQLQVSVTVAMVVLFIIGSLGGYNYVRVAEEEEFLENCYRLLEVNSKEVEMERTGELDAGFHDLALARFSESKEIDEDLYYVLRDYQGAVIFQSPWLKDATRLPFQQEARDGVVKLGRTTLSDGEPMRTASMSWQLPLEDLDPGEPAVVKSGRAENHDSQAPENRVHLIIAESDASMRHMLLILAIASSTNGVVITVITALLVMYLVGRASRPIEALSSRCAQIEALSSRCAQIEPYRLDARLPESEVPSELSPLVEQFNSLLARVERAL